jgi:hypothetical protein
MFRPAARKNLGRLLSFVLILSGWVSQGHADPARLDIRVQLTGFGKFSREDITAVLESAAGQFWQHCGSKRLPGIDVYHRTDHPETNFSRAANGRIAVGLTARGTHWAQYSFQFAHEFCHILAHAGDDAGRNDGSWRHANFWLEESLCETASLFTLRAMGRAWQAEPPFPPWRSYAPWLEAYAQQRMASRQRQLQTPFVVWFKGTEPALRADPTLRVANTVIAIKLLPLFEANPDGWRLLTFLNKGPRGGDETLAQRFAQWRSQSPQSLQPFVAKLAAVFGIKL